MTKKELSVILTTYNRKTLLRKAIHSVLGQTFSDFELIIVDDGSTDGTREYLQTLTDETNIRVLFNEYNLGVAESRNRGIQAAAGEWIVFVDDDDTMYSDKLLYLHKTISQNRALNFIYHPVNITYIKEGVNGISNTRAVQNLSRELLIHNIVGGPNNVAVKKDLLQNCGFFDTTLEQSEDYELWIRLSQCPNFNATFIDVPLAEITIDTGDRKSVDKNMVALKQTSRLIEKRYKEKIGQLTAEEKLQRREYQYRRLAVVALHQKNKKETVKNLMEAFKVSKKKQYLFGVMVAVVNLKLFLHLSRRRS